VNRIRNCTPQVGDIYFTVVSTRPIKFRLDKADYRSSRQVHDTRGQVHLDMCHITAIFLTKQRKTGFNFFRLFISLFNAVNCVGEARVARSV
jgi:hypothetical protein